MVESSMKPNATDQRPEFLSKADVDALNAGT
ncbi:MAG: hypothetical protein ACI8Z0_002734, partial [Lentimonas sp.]